MSQANTIRSGALVLEHAAKIGLPEPNTVYAYDWSTALHLTFDNVGDLAEWARYCETQVAEHETASGAMQYSIGIGEKAGQVTVLDLPIEAWCIITAKKRAEQAAL